MKAKLIGITGKAGAGKDSLADAMVKEFGAVKYSFALPLKQGLNAMLDWSMAQWDDRVWKETVIDWLGKSPRQFAQTLGTEWGRELINPALWVLLAMERYRKHCASGSTAPFVIADMRFDNEAKAILALGGTVLRIVRPGIDAVNAHVSEAGVRDDLISYTLVNDGTLEQFLRNALGHAQGVA